MEKKYYQTEEKKKEKHYQNKKYTFKKKMKCIKYTNIILKKQYKWTNLIIGNNYYKYPRIKIIIKKKNIKLSTKRNKIKRNIYENFRINQFLIKNKDFIFFIKKNILNITKYDLKKKINNIWKLSNLN